MAWVACPKCGWFKPPDAPCPHCERKRRKRANVGSVDKMRVLRKKRQASNQ